MTTVWSEGNRVMWLALMAGVGVAWLLVAVQSVWQRQQLVRSGQPKETIRDLVVRRLSWSMRIRLARKLMHAGLLRWQVGDLVLLYLTGILLSGVTALVVERSLWVLLLGVAGSFWLIEAWVQQRKRLYSSRIAADLPGFLDLLCLCLFAGMGFNNALLVVLRYMMDGPLRVLWRDWIFEVRAGSTRVDALTRLLHKSEQASLQRLCVAMIQAEKTGAALAPGLQSQARQLRTEQLLSAERRAAQAPMRMLLPLILCFFPSTFLVLGFSIWVGVNDMF